MTVCNDCVTNSYPLLTLPNKWVILQYSSKEDNHLLFLSLGVVMTKYRSLIVDLDHTFKLDNERGYKALSIIVAFWMGLVTASILLSLGVVVM